MTNNGGMTGEQAEALMRLISELGLCQDVKGVQMLGWSHWGVRRC